MFEKLQLKKQIKEGLNIDEFLRLPNTTDKAGLIVITPYQIFDLELIYGYSHGKTLNDIFKLIYKDFNGFESGRAWSNYINEFGNIIITLSTGSYQEAFLPKKCNSFQFEKLMEINKIIKENNVYDRNFCYPNVNIKEENYKNLDIGLKYLYPRIDDNIKTNEILLKLNSKTK